MNERFSNIPVELENNFDKKVAEVFSLYDRHKINLTSSKNLEAILGLLGCAPNKQDLQEITTAVEQRKKIHLGRLIPFLRSYLQKGKMRPLSKDDLLNAFKILDPKDRGFIPKAEFVKLMTDFGDPLSENELKEMLVAAVDINDYCVHYEDYVDKIVMKSEGGESIFLLAELPGRKTIHR
ncbi:dynein regulatory complex protein 8-like [Chironomus tepperi]|uniref:dynein regulatory complex protein 8-like n=1 Tax=Chironomus tepperi TaxID=113505 RepID=UPI00391F292E